MRPWTGPLTIEGVQTGDGRVIPEGATAWVDPPLPLAWLQEEQHGDLLAGGVQVGTIDTITRETGGLIMGSGQIDDEQPDGAEVCRRMDAGTAPFGNRFGVSVDPDDWAVELVLMDTGEGEDGGVIIMASGVERRGRVLRVLEGEGPLPRTRPQVTRTAAAGDPDPGPGGGDEGATLFEYASDEVIERYTRLRIRGATLCAIPAFDGAYVELSDGPAPVAEGDTTEPVAAAAPEIGNSASVRSEFGVARSAAAPAERFPVAPPMAWVSDPSFGEPGEDMRLIYDELEDVWGCPFSVMADGRVFGHAGLWGTCHIGYPDTCLEPPPSMSGYAHFLTGGLETAEGETIAVGRITLSGGHADLRLSAAQAMAHYDDTRSAIADVVAGEDRFGIWVAGALRPNVTDEQLRVLRASPLSGDWRPIGGSLELVATLCVNVPGYRVPRARAHTASSGTQTALVAAGAAPLARMREAQADPLASINQRLAALERRTAPLMRQGLEAIRDRARAG